MDDFLTDQQQAARVRGWVREYAPSAILAVAIGIGGYFGYTQWQVRQDRQAAEASELYEDFRAAIESDDRDSAGTLLESLVADYEGSGYADHARLLMAKEYVDTTQPSRAEQELQAVIETTSNGDLRQLARLRLARVYLYMDRPEDGLETLDADVYSPAWRQLTEDMRGDLHQALGQTEAAHAAYQAALEHSGQIDAAWIRLKLDHLAAVGADEAEAPAPDPADESTPVGEGQ
ncbi:MAG: tetratricopeptide repeat protein [Gammaproteobacteria bacterium]|nr:tetratricopeptide repeat protein [Gammaproteobacteria bacterium]MXW44560.1 tetratricopeptide repeat protein [Gammaproteobacteria bacterium]MYD02257.1 tetratricopeptide repeat protein [Gammaproteobacteria bacterium]MYI24721.1 tetratricopeptide repeat protein [Gammaproteobacteria bacterium]